MPAIEEFNVELLSFLKRSPTPFHAVATMRESLESAGFEALKEADAWQVTAGKYYVTRNDSSLIAFVKGTSASEETGIRLVGAHTDSPCLKVKPNPLRRAHGYLNVGVEVYGGVLLNPWFDRDLSLAGRITYEGKDGDLASCLIDFERAIATIPSLAIHLDRDANTGRSINSQKDIPPLLLKSTSEQTFDDILMEQIRQQHPELEVSAIHAWELSFYDTQAPARNGLNNEFIASARLDNLLSCYVGMRAICTADPTLTSIFVCNDHEEIGSGSAEGAEGPFLATVIDRLIDSKEQRYRTLDQSLMISTDNAHGIHPNYADRHDPNHGPRLNEGPVIKINANQRYATNSETSAYFSRLCKKQDVPYQKFVVRTDMGCGSTIGPITAKEIGVKTMDVGVPTFAMHSIRELAGSDDAHHLYRALTAFYSDARLFPR